MYVCVHICFSFRTHMGKPFKHESSLYASNKSFKSLYFTYAQVTPALKVRMFLSWIENPA